MKALHDLVVSGKVRYIGASSMMAWQFQKAQNIAISKGWTPFVTMQNHYNLCYREEEREMIPYCLDSGVGLLPWSPLARGFLTGNRSIIDKELAAAAAATTATTTTSTATAAKDVKADDQKKAATVRATTDPVCSPPAPSTPP